MHLVKKKSSLHLSPKWFPLPCLVSKGLFFVFVLNRGLSMTERGERVSKELEIDKNDACADSL